MKRQSPAPSIPSRRKRGKERLNKACWVYFNPSEHDIIDQASDLERRSKSSFIADAALDKALEILRIYNQSVAAKQRK